MSFTNHRQAWLPGSICFRCNLSRFGFEHWVMSLGVV
jgi:hypothetical protein